MKRTLLVTLLFALSALALVESFLVGERLLAALSDHGVLGSLTQITLSKSTALLLYLSSAACLAISAFGARQLAAHTKTGSAFSLLPAFVFALNMLVYTGLAL